MDRKMRKTSEFASSYAWIICIICICIFDLNTSHIHVERAWSFCRKLASSCCAASPGYHVICQAQGSCSRARQGCRCTSLTKSMARGRKIQFHWSLIACFGEGSRLSCCLEQVTLFCQTVRWFNWTSLSGFNLNCYRLISLSSRLMLTADNSHFSCGPRRIQILSSCDRHNWHWVIARQCVNSAQWMKKCKAFFIHLNQCCINF